MSAEGLKDRKNAQNIHKAFALLEPLMYDSAVYIKKNLGPFLLGSHFGNSFPGQTFAQLDKWIKIKDPHVRWNIGMAFNNSFGNKYPEKSLKYLKVLSKDTNKIVQRAVVSTLGSLRKRHKTLIENFTNKHALKI